MVIKTLEPLGNLDVFTKILCSAAKISFALLLIVNKIKCVNVIQTTHQVFYFSKIIPGKWRHFRVRKLI